MPVRHHSKRFTRRSEKVRGDRIRMKEKFDLGNPEVDGERDNWPPDELLPGFSDLMVDSFQLPREDTAYYLDIREYRTAPSSYISFLSAYILAPKPVESRSANTIPVPSSHLVSSTILLYLLGFCNLVNLPVIQLTPISVHSDFRTLTFIFQGRHWV